MKLSKYRIYISLICILIVTSPLLASNIWIPMETPVDYHEFQFISHYGQDIVWAIGSEASYNDPKTLFKSTDAGNSWELQHTFDSKISEFDFITANIGFALQFNTILKTIDGGNTWTKLPRVAGMATLEVVSDNILWGGAVNMPNTFKSIDGGINWTTQSLPTFATAEIFSVLDNDHAWVGNNDRFAYTTDGGTNWVSKKERIKDMVITSNNTGYAILSDYDLHKTTDNGENWTKVLDPNFSNTHLYASDDQSAWIVGNDISNIPIFRTINAGDNWHRQSIYSDPFPYYTLYDVSASDSNLAWISGKKGIYKYAPSPELTLLYPNAGDDLNAGETVQIAWESQSIETLDIYYTSDGSNWVLVEDSVDASLALYNWQTPMLTSQNCKIKLEPSRELFRGESQESDGYFSISIPPISFREFDLYDQCEFSENNPLNVLGRDIPIRLKVKVKNNLTQNLLSASGTLSTSNPYINLSSSSSSYNNILVNSEEWSSEEFEFTISTNAPDEFVVDFDLTINDQIVTGGPWTGHFSLPIILDPFEIGLVLVDDDSNPDSQGDNDDIIEPGEHAEIIPLLNNVSTNEYDNVEGKLFSLSEEIEIWDVRSGASGVVYAKYPYNVISGSQETVSALQENIMPEQDFVLTYNYSETFSFPLLMQITADVPKYDNMEMRWTQEFTMNPSHPVVSIREPLPETYSLTNYPNPFNPSTTIYYAIPEDLHLKLNIYTISGQLVETLVDGFSPAGVHKVSWNANGLNSGIFFYRLEYGQEYITRKMVLVK
ncbi:MAG: T9SS type A sorting domain-containing protein [Candidatus Neomarinimicrobiota bacterium]